MIIRGCKMFYLIALIGCMLLSVGVLPSFAGDTHKKLDLYEQDAYGQIIQDGAKGKLEYTLAGPNLVFEFKASGLDRNTEYALIRSREPEVVISCLDMRL